MTGRFPHHIINMNLLTYIRNLFSDVSQIFAEHDAAEEARAKRGKIYDELSDRLTKARSHLPSVNSWHPFKKDPPPNYSMYWPNQTWFEQNGPDASIKWSELYVKSLEKRARTHGTR